MTRDRGVLFRTYVPSLVACLEDADSGVRETAKTTVIDLFQYALSSQIIRYVFLVINVILQQCPSSSAVGLEEATSIT